MPFARALSLVRDVVDLVYPTACACCLAHTPGAGPLCAACHEQLVRQEEAAACPACAMPLANHGDPCPYCEGKGEPNFEQVVRLTVYANPAQTLIHRMKYHGRWALAEFFGDRLVARPAVQALLYEADVLVPVPLHPLRQLSRGYNQAEVLARRLRSGIRAGLGRRVRVARPLVRARNTPTQTAVHSRANREENLRDAFALVDPRAVAGKHVVVVDDVTTTGATLQSVARALKPAKPASMSAIAISIADPKGRAFSVI
ncbi:MAG TPA: phosphoribosyltransferase family protein [Humisphaera sp.]